MQIQVNDISMAYTASGDGLPLVFVHGYPLSRRIWEPQASGLADAALILAPDLRGHGDSQTLPGPYSMDLFADDLNAFLDALGITRRIVLCGLSMGGYIAFAFWRKYAARLAGLILTSTRPAADSPQGKIGRDQSAENARQNGVSAIAERMIAVMLSPKTYTADPDLVAHVKTIMETTSLEGVLGDLAALKERPDSTPDLAYINIPTLVVHGADDQIIPVDDAHSMHAAIPGSLLEVIPDSGHLPCLENPTAYNSVVRQFLNDI